MYQFLKESVKLFKLDEEKVNEDEERRQIMIAVQEYQRNARLEMDKRSKTNISLNAIKDIVLDLKASNTQGWDGLSINMVKYIKGNQVLHKIKTLINAIICCGKTPSEFNRSIQSCIIANF